jgi:hypothetical protein
MDATPQYNLKTGADTQLYLAREVTSSNVKEDPSSFTRDDIGKIMDSVKTGDTLYEYPVLIRRTGDSLKGTTETLQSSELRKGRTKSAPRKGSGSSEGSIDLELSPETYDDAMCAVMRNEWKSWTGDTNSESNLDKFTYPEGMFATQMGLFDENGAEITPAPANPYKKLLASDGTGFINTNADIELHELTPGKKDIKYSCVKQYGGVEGEDLYMEFEHLAANSINLSMSPNQIVTGSIAFMGGNDPSLEREGVATPEPTGFTKTLLGRFHSSDKGDAEAVKKWIENLPDQSTSTDQFVASEIYLHIGGKRVRFSSNVTFQLNNGLEKTFAVGEKSAISTTPLQLAIDGNLSVYLINLGDDSNDIDSKELFDLATKNKDVEICFAIMDKKENPQNFYVFQIFTTKLTDHDASTSGEGTIDMSLPYDSFGERACRIIRGREKRVVSMTTDFDTTSVNLDLSSIPTGKAAGDDVSDVITGSVTVAGKDPVALTFALDGTDAKKASASFSGWEAPTDPTVVTVEVSYNEIKRVKTYTYPQA